MRLSDDAMYRHFLERDSACNGKFLTGVISTGIYCLPSCPARRPKRENIRFFRTLPEAQQSGLRPCRRCRPDFFYRGAEWHENLYEETAARVRRDPAAFRDISSLTTAAGLSRTALNHLFRVHAHESPAAFLRRLRVERVCRLLEQGTRPSDAAAAAGFDSASSFHEQFVARTGLTPAVYGALQPSAEFTLRLPPHYRFREVLDFYGRDPLSVSESLEPHGLKKAFQAGGKAALVEIRFTSSGAVCHSDARDIYAAHRVAARMLGIDSDAAGFERQFAGDPLLGEIVSRQQGLRIPLTPEPWEALAWAIIGQQISLKAAVTLRRELIAAIGHRHPSALHAHPNAEAVANLDVDALRRLKFSGSKAEYLLTAARAVACGELPLPALREMSALRGARLMGQIRGIGPWTVQYCSLRGLGFADCLPAGDAGLAQGLERLAGDRPSEMQIREIMAKYAPHRSLATYHIWASLKENLNHAD